MSLNTTLHSLRAVMTHPHHVELGVLGAALLAALVWFEIRKPAAWVQWLVLSVLMGPGFLFMIDDRGVGLDTSPSTLGLALAVGVGGAGMITLRAFMRRERSKRLEEDLALEKWRHARPPPMNLDG